MLSNPQYANWQNRLHEPDARFCKICAARLKPLPGTVITR